MLQWVLLWVVGHNFTPRFRHNTIIQWRNRFCLRHALFLESIVPSRWLAAKVGVYAGDGLILAFWFLGALLRRAKAPAKHIAIVALNAAIAALAGKGAQPDYLMGDLFPGNVDYHVLRIRIQQDSRPVHITRLRANISCNLLRVPTSQRLHIRQTLP